MANVRAVLQREVLAIWRHLTRTSTRGPPTAPPYDNLSAQGYPSIYVHTGLWDSQVQYYEPAKWIARLRATTTGANPVLLDTNLSAGHGGASGRFDALKEVARAYAFLLGTSARPDRRGA